MTTFWTGDLASLPRGRPVVVGFPQDEGVRRNGGRVGSALGPQAIRTWLYRLVAGDPSTGGDLGKLGVIDVGDVDCGPDLEASQAELGRVVASIRSQNGVPLVLGGGHEAAQGLYLGHVAREEAIGIVNLDAHLDVRPLIDGQGHSGSPFRQMLEHPTRPLPGEGYVCLGAQPFSISTTHTLYLRERGGTIGWRDEVAGNLGRWYTEHANKFMTRGWKLHLSIDADVVRAADVPGVSAPNPAGLSGDEVVRLARLAGASGHVSSLELVEVAPPFDVDDRSARWAAVVLWSFLAGWANSGPHRP